MDAVRGIVPSGSFGLPDYAVLDRTMTLVDEYVLGASNALAIADELMETEIPDHSDDWPMPGDLELAADIDPEARGETAAPSGGSRFSSGGTETPFGGAACSAAANHSAGASVLLALLGAAGVSRRRR